LKIKSDIHSGQTFQQCDQVRNWWKEQAHLAGKWAKNPNQIPAGLYVPGVTNVVPPTYPPVETAPPTTPTTPPTAPTTPSSGHPTTCGGYVNGIYYPDRSGSCG
jgi:hypothetical protein